MKGAERVMDPRFFIDADATWYERNLATVFVLLVALFVIAVLGNGYFVICQRVLSGLSEVIR